MIRQKQKRNNEEKIKRAVRLRGTGFAAMSVAVFFIFNPDVFAIVDVLPDFIGYAIVCLSLLKLRDISPHMETAFGGFKKAALLSAAKYLALYLTFALSGGSERSMLLLLWAFVFAVADVLAVVPAWRAYFEGISYTAQTGDSSFVLSDDGRGKSRIAKIERATVAFIIAKDVLAVLPETATLSSHIAYDDTAFDFSPYLNMFRVFSFFASLVVCSVWLVLILRWLSRARTDRAFAASVSERTARMRKERPGFFIRRRVKYVFTLFIVAAVLGTEIVADNVILPPGLLCGGAFFALFALCRGYSSRLCAAGTAVSCAYGAVSTVFEIVYRRFYSEYSVSRVFADGDTFKSYAVLCSVKILRELLLAAAFVLALAVVKRLADEHCGDGGERNRSALADFRRDIGKKQAVCAVLATVSSFVSLLSLLMPLARRESLETFFSKIFVDNSRAVAVAVSAAQKVAGEWWIAALACEIGLAVAVYSFVGEIRLGIDVRYGDD